MSNQKMRIPDNYIEFLYWFKATTETHWENMSKSNASDYKDDDWIINAKWIGLEETEIENIERKYNIVFTSEHKEFLKILHTIDKKRPVEYYDSKNETYVKQKPYFYNWLLDDEEIRHFFDWPYRTILSDVKNTSWLKSWGERPKSEAEIEKVFSEWYHKAPKLIPIHAHRFVVSIVDEIKSPVLSVWGADTIVYGWSMKHYLLNELGKYLDLHKSVYDEEDKLWYPEPIKELQDFMNKERTIGESKGIPFWDELIS